MSSSGSPLNQCYQFQLPKVHKKSPGGRFQGRGWNQVSDLNLYELVLLPFIIIKMHVNNI